jgi:hypothetical protein
MVIYLYLHVKLVKKEGGSFSVLLLLLLLLLRKKQLQVFLKLTDIQDN